MKNYQPFIGLEIHFELATKSKMFCGCSAYHFQVKPNTITCPVCLGLPGALPVPNKKAIEWTILVGLALNCKVNRHSYFERKQYFYPDLAKGYQISQYEFPFCYEGKLDGIRINRTHLEEDTGKLLHRKVDGQEVTLVDFNRSGVPLVEIVTEPDFSSAKQVREWLQQLQQLIRYLGISDCDMEKGSMRLEANVSVSTDGKLPSYKVELKNINSFKFTEKAIEYEIQRQIKLLEKGEKGVSETRGFNEDKGITVSQRSKEEAFEYRYFPEPDIPPIIFSQTEIEEIRSQLPELPQTKRDRFITKYQLKENVAAILVGSRELADYYEKLVKIGQTDKGLASIGKNIPEHLANLMVNKKIDWQKVKPKEFIKQAVSQKQDQVADQNIIADLAQEVVKENPKAVKDYRSGKTSVIGFLVGQIMQKKRVDPNLARQSLQKILS